MFTKGLTFVYSKYLACFHIYLDTAKWDKYFKLIIRLILNIVYVLYPIVDNNNKYTILFKQ